MDTLKMMATVTVLVSLVAGAWWWVYRSGIRSIESEEVWFEQTFGAATEAHVLLKWEDGRQLLELLDAYLARELGRASVYGTWQAVGVYWTEKGWQIDAMRPEYFASGEKRWKDLERED